MPDVLFADLPEDKCLACHTLGVPAPSGPSPHHFTEQAQSRHCKVCHGSIVDDYDDGHYIPTYEPSLVTPDTGSGEGSPFNSRGNGAGGCTYCHDDDGLSPPLIRTTEALHHDPAFYTADKCDWCHDFSVTDGQIRACESCHGPNSLHNIQADSPNPENAGTIVVGGEDAGYGHVGRDAGPGDSDCWGCHGFSVCGNGVPEGIEECDDGNTQDGDCCSSDCAFEAVGSSCADAAFCNGNETCDGSGACLSGLPVVCNDGVACTSDACDEANDRCASVPDNTACTSDGLFCTGQEICDAVVGCVGTGNPCPTGTTCYETTDVCIPVSGKVSVCHVPAGNPAKAKTLSVDAGLVIEHLAHGDKLGPCPQ